MNRKNILLLTFILSLTFSSCNSSKTTVTDKPNIVILFTDDQRFNTINTLNNDEIITPTMDKLAKGTVFTHCHIMGGFSGAVCTPSRAMLMTSKSLFHLKQNGKIIPQEHSMLPETLRKNGYNTFGTGKWHNDKKSFARSFTHGANIFFGGMSDHLQTPINDYDPKGKYEKEDTYIGKKFSSQLFTDGAVDFINNYKDNKPFFMFVSYTSPHDPRMAPEKYVKMYDTDKIELPPNFMPKHPFDNGELIIRDELLEGFPRTPKIVKENIAAYYAMITEVDEQMGRIVTALEKKQLMDNTIIIFAGDNGLAVGQHGLLGKQNLYEHSVRVPLMLYGKGIKKGIKIPTLTYLNDIYPTLCEILDLPPPTEIEGESLVPALKDPNTKIRDNISYSYKNFQRGITDDQGWKLIKYLVKGKHTTQLFNTNEDPWEINNLANDPKYQDKLNELTQTMQQRAKKIGDKVQFDKADWGVPVVESWEDAMIKRGREIIIPEY